MASSAPDLAGLIADKDFQGMAPGDQRAVLGRATGDKSFSDLSDGDTMQFVSRATARIQSTRPDLIPPPGVPRPQVNMQQSLLGQRDTSDPDVARIDRSINQYGTLAPTPGDAFTGAAIAGAPLAAEAAGPIARVGAKWVAQNPIKSMLAIEALKQSPAGKYINKVPGAELLPFLLSEGKSGVTTFAKQKLGGIAKAGEQIVAEDAGATAAEAGDATRVAPQSARPLPTGGDAYKFKGAPDTMLPVQSSNVSMVGYNESNRMLTVQFKSGNVFSYSGVPPEKYQELLKADSVGSHFARQIKPYYEGQRRGSILGKK